MEELLLNLLESKNINTNVEGLIKLLNLNNNDKDTLIKVLNKLEFSGKIYLDNNGIYSNFPKNYKIGTVFIKGKNSFVKLNNKSIPLSKEYSNSLFSGDKIIVEIKGVKKPKAILKKILERKDILVIGEVKETNNNKYISIYNRENVKININEEELDKLSIGDRIQIQITFRPDNTITGKMVEYIGSINDFDTEIKSAYLNNGFPINFSKSILEEANNLPNSIKEEDLNGRIDLRNDQIFTIDSVKTKDMDDALSMKILSNGHFLLGVHIADVSHYVKPNSALFNEAKLRGTSVYPINTVNPMLPKIISNGICSLNEKEDRLTKTIEIEIDESGKVVKYNIFKSIINSKKKMSYEDLNNMFETNIIQDDYKEYWESITNLRELNKILSKINVNNGSLEFDDSELNIFYDKDNKISNISKFNRGESELIIANCMVLANSLVAEYVNSLELPFVYRNHLIPDKEKLNHVIEYFNRLGYGLKRLKDIKNPKNLQKTIYILRNRKEFSILSRLILQGLKKADYGITNAGHFGLGLKTYTHFTSPIRRFPDLMVHTLLDKYEKTKDFSDVELKELEEKLSLYTKSSSERERMADNVEYIILRHKLIEYIDNNIGKEFNAKISMISDKKFIRVITDNGIEGIIWLKDLYDDDFVYNPGTELLVGKHTGVAYKVGFNIKVKALKTSKEFLEIYFSSGNKDFTYRKK